MTDLTRDDAQEAITRTKRDLAALRHLAIAGMLHANIQAPEAMAGIMYVYDRTEKHIAALGAAALLLPAAGR